MKYLLMPLLTALPALADEGKLPAAVAVLAPVPTAGPNDSASVFTQP